MKVRIAATAIALLAGATFFAGAARAAADDDEVPIDCSNTDLQFTGDRFEVKCAELKGEQIYQAYGAAQVQAKMLTADSTQAGDWLIGVDFRLLGSLAVRRTGLADNINSYFSKLPVKNWKSVGTVQGFEAAEFESAGPDDVSNCVAFQRFFNRRYDGFSRWLVGVSCSTDGKEAAYKTLAGFSGPGD